jgi:sec-independent protein translocase protein TatB
LFDVAFSELLVVAVVALIVIGPEKLPKVARTLGLLAGRMQRYVSGIKADVERELRTHELQNIGAEMRQGIGSVQAEVGQEMRKIEQAVEQPVADAGETPQETAKTGMPGLP